MSKAISQRKEELRLQTPEGLKDMYPLYPIVRRNQEDKEIAFSTLVRKRYEGKYYLIPVRVTDISEAKAIHNLHAYVYRFFMLGALSKEYVIDNDQTNEIIRLKNLNN
jgi:hypothetical protein